MDRVECYIDGFQFAEATASRDHTLVFGGERFKNAADLFETVLDILEPNSENAVESARQKLRERKRFEFFQDKDKT